MRKPVAAVPVLRTADEELAFLVFCDDGTVWEYTPDFGWEQREGPSEDPGRHILPGSAADGAAE